MHKLSILNKILVVIGLAVLILGCQLLTGATETGEETIALLADPGPKSTLDPPLKVIEVAVGETLVLESRHVSQAQLDTLEIYVNDQPLGRAEGDSQVVPFSEELATVELFLDEQPVSTYPVHPEFPTTDWTVSLVWVGKVPGTYELKLVATDTDGHEGEPVITQIEVK